MRIWQRVAVLPQQEAEAKTCKQEGKWSVEGSYVCLPLLNGEEAGTVPFMLS